MLFQLSLWRQKVKLKQPESSGQLELEPQFILDIFSPNQIIHISTNHGATATAVHSPATAAPLAADRTAPSGWRRNWTGSGCGTGIASGCDCGSAGGGGEDCEISCGSGDGAAVAAASDGASAAVASGGGTCGEQWRGVNQEMTMVIQMVGHLWISESENEISRPFG